MCGGVCIQVMKSQTLTEIQGDTSNEYNFFNSYLAAPWPTFGHSQGYRFTNPMLITAFRDPRNEVGSLSPVERLVGFEPVTFHF